MRFSFLLIFLFVQVQVYTQNTKFKSIHQEQSEYYSNLYKDARTFTGDTNFDFHSSHLNKQYNSDCDLEYIVFGYHPYWMGSTYLNYRWNLLSDLCYFSYEVDPTTGDPLTTHGWLNTPVVDSAQANAVRTHLCVTLFSDHSTFFSDPDNEQNLIDNLIWHVQQRNADGINMDFEAVPYSLIDDYMVFLVDLCEQFHAAVPEGMLSIAMPAVDWSGLYDIALLKNYIDLFIIMGYDYYWNGSSEAGPVAPLYSLTEYYNYNLSRTISYYLSEGMPLNKFILGQPYYAREWPTESNSVPSNTTGSGYAYTYAQIKKNSGGFYIPENHYWNPKSFSGYYVFYSDGWYQCFIEEEHGLGKRYDIVRQRDLAGTGIWALGYDNGYSELWNLIESKFTDCAEPAECDTIYDSGGPYWDYYHSENYTAKITIDSNQRLSLEFIEFSLEQDYDSLWIFDGPDTLSPLLGGFSGETLPGTIIASACNLMLLFKSDDGMAKSGWTAIYESKPLLITEDFNNYLTTYPNPFSDNFYVDLNMGTKGYVRIKLFDISGNCHFTSLHEINSLQNNICVNTPDLTPGMYFLVVCSNDDIIATNKIIKTY